MMEDPDSTQIGLKAVKGANALCKYYLNCTFKIMEETYSSVNQLNKLPENKKRFYKALKRKFTTAEAIELGKTFDFQKRRLNDFLKEKYFFRRIKQGYYEKKITE